MSRRDTTTHADDLVTEIARHRNTIKSRTESLRRLKESQDALVAAAVSSEPDRIDWYEHPGPVDRRDVMEAAGLTTMQLHRTMERYRLANPPRRRRRKPS